MLFDFNLKSSILLVFFFHGAVFSSLLLIKGIARSDKPILWLSLFTILCTLYICPFLLGYAGWYAKDDYRDILFYIPFQQLFLLPPVLYFYCRSLLDRSFFFSRRHLLHFLPAALYLLYSAIVFITDKVVLHDYYFYKDGKDKDLSTWYQVAGFVSLICYLLQSLGTYRNYKKITYDVVSFAEAVLFKWAHRFLIAFLLLSGIRVLYFVLNPEWDQFGRKFWYYVCFSLLFYYISISGYINAAVSRTSFKNKLSTTDPSTTSVLGEAVEKDEPNPVIAGDAGKNPGANIPDLDVWKDKIEKLMDSDRLFEDPELTLSDFCGRLGINSKKASQLINQGFNMNFNDFVNHYRTRAVISKIHEGKHTLQTLLGIAYECGFNSKSTFNRAFKRYTSMTPREYIERETIK